MEIYKLSDNVSGEKLRITELKQGVKNPERVNVFVNGKYSFSLDIAQVVELGVKVGRKVSEEELLELKKASDFGKLYQRALEWVLTRPRSERETYDYLRRKVYDKKLDGGYISGIIERLKEKKYLDDRRFAEFWVENRFVKKGVSSKRLRMELMQKGVAKEIVEEVLMASSRDDREEILKVIAKKRAKYDDEKLIMYLVRQGFDFGLSRELVQSCGKD